FSYLDPERGLLGETWLASTELDGVLNEQGMVCDFGIVKKTLRHWLDEEIDHRLLVPVKSPNLTLIENGTELDIEWRYSSGQGNTETIRCTSPRSSIALVDCERIDASSVSRWSISQILPLLPATLNKLSLDFSTEAIEGSFYHYSHGLKKHDGNCQRIAHGHRSKLLIWRNQERDTGLEQQWSSNFKDIYIGTREDIVEQNDGVIVFAYTTNQGSFRLSLPTQHCYIINTDSTVEWIADHLAQQLKQAFPQDEFLVKAFEGMGKGAIVSA
ncbi:MAG: 6-carboxytetrahydropterin synthase, partial [Pseudomonadota bacterium]|nr:6-carboxytetrahydropterin synthase [Pseudomonadota bacterium]